MSYPSLPPVADTDAAAEIICDAMDRLRDDAPELSGSTLRALAVHVLREEVPS